MILVVAIVPSRPVVCIAGMGKNGWNGKRGGRQQIADCSRKNSLPSAVCNLPSL
ncbi:MAG: hypothetical protein FWE67_00055 [Planctomycetaceae bacterium]|nr:hypothetical protein [Planctomycetaceae bacterium]